MWFRIWAAPNGFRLTKELDDVVSCRLIYTSILQFSVENVDLKEIVAEEKQKQQHFNVINKSSEL